LSFVQPDHAALRSHYENEWSKGRPAFTEGTYRADPVPRDGVPRFGLSLVVSAEGSFADKIAAESDAIASRCRGTHLNYVPRDLHMTVRSVEGYQDTVPQRQIDHYLGQLKRATEGLGPISARFEGLGGSRTTIDFGTIETNEISLVVWRPDLRAANIEVIERISW
jgi:hypothetical protein